ncbi:hypothetical protein [Brachybacterium sp. UNK5269]
MSWFVIVDDRSDVESEFKGDLGNVWEPGNCSVWPWRGDQADAVGPGLS